MDTNSIGIAFSLAKKAAKEYTDSTRVWGRIGGTLANQTDLNSALTALSGRIGSLESLGRFLSTFNCVTGRFGSEPPGLSTGDVYTFKRGDWAVISNVSSATPPVNYIISGSSYTVGSAYSTTTSENVAVKDVLLFDGANWLLLKNAGVSSTFKFTVTDTGEGYTTTATSDQILAAIQAGKMPICCHSHPQGGDLELLLKTYNSSSVTFVGLFMFQNVLTQMQIVIYGSDVGTVETYRMYDWGSSIASTFNEMEDYNVGDYVIYGDASSASLYKCIAAYTGSGTPGEPSYPPSANFTTVRVMAEVKNKFGRDGATALDTTLVSGKQYQLGNKSATFNMVLPATASYNDFIEVIFKATAAFTPTSSGGTAVGDTLPTTVANKTYDILYTWTGTNWLCQYLYW